MSTYELLIPAHIPSLRRYARALTGDGVMADDLVQDTLERAYVKFHLWQADSDLRKWLFAVMHNVFINHVRKPSLRLVSDDHVIELESQVLDTDPGTAIDIARGLNMLSEEQREVLFLVVLEGLRYEEVGQLLGIPLGTVMSRLSRARDRLTGFLSEGSVVRERIKVEK
jgi:RNA polymerase sigma-70 factor (ECF subfamily)